MKLKNIDSLKIFQVENKEAKIKVVKVLDDIVSMLCRDYENDIVSIVLFGSIARGEGVYRRKNETIKIVSDLDLLVITRRRILIPLKLKKLRQIVKEIEKKENIHIDLKFVCYNKLKYLVTDTHTLDRREGITIWGEDVTSEFPEFKYSDITFEDAIFLFFNRVFLTIKDFPIFSLNDEEAKEWLSHEASKTIFTCTDIISICYNKYHPSVLRRVDFVKKVLQNLDIPNKESFLEDLDRAVSFRFREIEEPYVDYAYNFWIRSREYLIKILLYMVKRSKLNFTNEKNFELQLLHLYTTKYKVKYKRLLYSIYNLLTSKRLPKLPTTRPQYVIGCRMASLMLYMALNKKGLINDYYVLKAEKYLSMVCYLPRAKERDTKNKWMFLRNTLREFNNKGIF